MLLHTAFVHLNDCFILHGCCTPVSYTHLDVYKRQKYIIGAIKDMDVGDKVTYTTSEGTRTYEVVTIKKIRSDDWSMLEATADNRITMITCVAGDYSHRWCLQAHEVK